MNLFFGTTEMQTIHDLQKLAKTHVMAIFFGFDNSTIMDMDYEILEKNNIDKRVIDALKEKDCMTVNNVITTFDKIWFTLYDKEKNKSHTMAYVENNLFFNLDDIDISNLEADCKEAFEEFLDYKDYHSYNYNPTIMNGFGNDETITDFRVYRCGMALKFFGDLVCDFLGEPRIERNY